MYIEFSLFLILKIMIDYCKIKIYYNLISNMYVCIIYNQTEKHWNCFEIERLSPLSI